MSGGSVRGANRFVILKIALAAFVLAIVAVPPLVARAALNDTTLVNVSAAGADGDSGIGVAVSADGRYVAFESKATNLADGAQPGVTNIYLRDTRSGTTRLVSRETGAAGAGGDGDSSNPAVSPAGRYVAFESVADNLSPDDDNSVRNVFVRDTLTDTTLLVSRAADGTAATGDSSHPSVSANGTIVSFESVADNLSADDNDAFSNVYVKNMETGAVTVVSRISLGATGIPADGDSHAPTIDRDGRRVAFTSEADNLNAKDDNALSNVFVVDLQTKFISLVSRATDGFLNVIPADGSSSDAVISADGRYVAFVSYANNFVDEPIRTPQIADVFRRDIQGSKTVLVSRATGADGAPAFANSSHPAISGDGRFVAFESAAGNLSADDTQGSDVFVRGVDNGVTLLVSRQSGEAGAAGADSSYAPAMSRDGNFVAFSSDADNLGDGDADNPVRNIFMRQVPVSPPKPDAPPDLGSNDHSAHAGHDPSSPDHAGHTAAEHAGHTTATGGPAMTLFGPPVQDVDKLFMLAQVHADSNLVVTATVKLPGGRAAKIFRFKSFSRNKITAHVINRVRLRLAKSKLRTVKRALKRHKKLKATIVAKAQNVDGGAWSSVTRSVRLFD